MEGEETALTPERVSEQENVTVTGTLFQPLTFAPGDLEPVIVGGERSMLMSPTVADAVLPALSVHVPVLDWPTPSDDTA